MLRDYCLQKAVFRGVLEFNDTVLVASVICASLEGFL